MTTYQIKTKQELVRLQKQLQEKYRNEKIGEQNAYQEVDKFYKPLTEPLKTIAKAADEEKPKNILMLEPKTDVPATTTDTPAIEYQQKDTGLINFGELSEKYLKKGFLKDYDTAYGIKPIEGSPNFKLGRNEIKIDGDNISVVNGSNYIGTDGLWRLITLKNPGSVTVDDKEQYERLMFETKPFLRDDSDVVKANQGDKYKNIIKPLYKKYNEQRIQAELTPLKQRRASFSGTGTSNIKFLPSDLNKLIERHELLFLEHLAGNTSVFNEIQAINDELFSQGIFDKDDLKNITKYLFYKK